MSKTQEIIQQKMKMLQYDSDSMTYTKAQVMGVLEDILTTHGRELFENTKSEINAKNNCVKTKDNGIKENKVTKIVVVPVNDCGTAEEKRESISKIMDDAERDERRGVAGWRYNEYLERIWKSYSQEKKEEREFIKDLVDELESIMLNIIPDSKNQSFLDRLNRIIFKVKSSDIGQPPRSKAEELIREWQKEVYKKTGEWIEPGDYEDSTKCFAEWLVNNKRI